MILSFIEYLFCKLFKKLRMRAVKRCSISKKSKICSGTQIVDSEMGKYSDIGYDCVIVNTSIGSFVSIGALCRIGGAGHTVDWVSTSPVFNGNSDHLKKKFSLFPFEYSIRTTIGNDVWIGDCVMIKSGVVVGDGAVIGMGSVVTKNIPPYEVWAGNPARCIRARFDLETANRLLKTKWWDLSDEAIGEKAKYIKSPKDFIESFEQPSRG
jgi:acetyltransferase-like isoleucine patch superfamily enzyme